MVIKKNQFNITEKMDIEKNNLIDYNWNDIIRLGLFVARILSLPKERIYKGLYWLSKIKVKELVTTYL